MAFQIVDDLLDLEGEEQITGKSLGTDLAHRKMTLPLILLREQLGREETSRLQALFEESDPAHGRLLLEWLEETGVLQQARRTAEEYAQQATTELAGLKDSDAKRVLAELARFVVARNA
jgi:geranylgeranyl pyrophosphate synthase